MNNERRLRERLRSLLETPTEREWVEFKENNSEPGEIGEYISALSNAAALQEQRAAYLVWGIQDTTHRIVGTSFRPREQRIGNEELENWLTRLLEPRINLRIHELSYDSRLVVMFEIPPCEHMPVKWKDTAFIRVGSYKKKLKDYPEKERALWLRSSRTSFEKGIAVHETTGEKVLASLDYPAYFEMSGQTVPSTREGILERLQQERMVVSLGQIVGILRTWVPCCLLVSWLISRLSPERRCESLFTRGRIGRKQLRNRLAERAMLRGSKVSSAMLMINFHPTKRSVLLFEMKCGCIRK